MRTFEILFIVFLAASTAGLFAQPLAAMRGIRFMLAGLLFITFGMHFMVEGLRWSMVPLYLLGLILAAGLVFLQVSRLPAPRPWMGWLLAALILLFCLPPLLFPIPVLPQPSGPYAIGTTTFYWEYASRLDPATGRPRPLTAQVWYPADAPVSAPRAPYMEQLDAGGPVIARQFNLPAFALNHIRLAVTHSYQNPPVSTAQAAFPVLLFSHGWTGMRNQNTFQVEELVSHGYIVLAVDHTYGAAFTVLADGTVLFNDPQLIPGDSQTPAEFDQAVRPLGLMWVDDLRFELDQLERLSSGELPSVLQGRIDLQRIGALGHSTGGGAVAELCAVDARCKAGLSMDAWLRPFDKSVPQNGLSQPFLFMQSELWKSSYNPPLQQALFDHSPDSSRVIIARARHFDFSDINLLTPLTRLMKMNGPIQPARAHQVVTAFSLAFFDQALGQPSTALPDLVKRFPEVRFESHK